MIRMNISNKFNTLLFGAALVSSIAVSGIVINLSERFVSQAMQDKLSSVETEFKSELSASQRSATMLAKLVAEQQSVRQSFAAGNRDALAGEFKSAFEMLKAEFDVRQFQFHLPPATSFLRVHKPEKFGDDLSGFRNTVLEVNATKSSLSGLEAGVAGIGIRGLAPISLDDKHLGSVEFGLSLHSGFVEKFTSNTGHPAAIFALRDDGLHEIGTTLPAGQDPARSLDLAKLAGERVTFEEIPEARDVYVSNVFPDQRISLRKQPIVWRSSRSTAHQVYHAIARCPMWAAARVFLHYDRYPPQQIALIKQPLDTTVRWRALTD